VSKFYFISPSRGRLTIEETFKNIINYVKEAPEYQYKLVVGTDSQSAEGRVQFVTAIIVYRVGKGGRFFYRRTREPQSRSLRQRIYLETAKSLDVASRITHMLAETDYLVDEMDVEIHLDVGRHGSTSNMVKEVVGMVTGSGYGAKIKPDSYGASKVADKYTK